MRGYNTMRALLKYQVDGMWRQLIDRGDAWPESSSAMFSFAMITA